MPAHSIQAMTAASVVAFRVETLRSLIATDPGVASACAEELTRQLYRALDDLSEQAFLPVRKRLVRQLLDLAAMGEGPHLVVHASQQELADAVASVREVVTRNLHQLQEEGLIETARDEIVLLDPVRLTEEAAEPGLGPGLGQATVTFLSPGPWYTKRPSRHRHSPPATRVVAAIRHRRPGQSEPGTSRRLRLRSPSASRPACTRVGESGRSWGASTRGSHSDRRTAPSHWRA